MLTPQMLLDIGHELVVDLFAGGGGASTGERAALREAISQAIERITGDQEASDA